MTRDRAGEVVVKGVAEVLSEWSGLQPLEHKYDAFRLYGICLYHINKPEKIRVEAKRVYKAAYDIERAISALPARARSFIHIGFLSSRHATLIPLPDPHAATTSTHPDDLILCFARALKDGTKTLERYADISLEWHPKDSKNLDWLNHRVAVEVAEIYVRITKREPPKGGTNGPFQRLLHKVYGALGRPVENLRGPLRKVHEYRKNRHSST